MTNEMQLLFYLVYYHSTWTRTVSETCRVIINQVKQKLHLVGYLSIQYCEFSLHTLQNQRGLIIKVTKIISAFVLQRRYIYIYIFYMTCWLVISCRLFGGACLHLRTVQKI